MYIGEIILQYRNSCNPKMSQRAFAEKTNLSASYINTLEKVYNPKNNKPYEVTTSVAVAIANAMGITINELLSQLSDEQEIITNDTIDVNITGLNKKTRKTITVPIYGTIPAGIPIDCIQELIDTEEIDADSITSDKQYFGLKIKGDSMTPDYQDGDVIILESVNDCESGDDCVVMVNGNDGTFKRVFKNENGIILQPLNPAYQPLIYSNKQIKSLPVRILGVVKELRRKLK